MFPEAKLKHSKGTFLFIHAMKVKRMMKASYIFFLSKSSFRIFFIFLDEEDFNSSIIYPFCVQLLLRKKAAEELKKEQERKAMERRKVIDERCGQPKDLESASEGWNFFQKKILIPSIFISLIWTAILSQTKNLKNLTWTIKQVRNYQISF